MVNMYCIVLYYLSFYAKLNSLQKTYRPLPFILILTLCLIVPHVVKATEKAGMKVALMNTWGFFSK